MLNIVIVKVCKHLRLPQRCDSVFLQLRPTEANFASVGLTLVHFTLMNGVGVPKNYVLQLVLITLIKKTSPFHHSVIICQNQLVELTLQYVLFTKYINIYIYILTDNCCQKVFKYYMSELERQCVL